MMKTIELSIGMKVFFRGTKSRKPYLVTIVSNPDNWNRVEICFSNGNTAEAELYELFSTWEEAAKVAPIRPVEINEESEKLLEKIRDDLRSQNIELLSQKNESLSQK